MHAPIAAHSDRFADRRRSGRARAVAATLVLAACGLAPVRAEIRIGSKLSPTSIPEGEVATFVVRVVGEGRHGRPVVKTDPSVKVTDGGTNQSLQLRGFGGNSQIDIHYSFILTPEKQGQFKVEAEIPIEGDVLLTEPSTLTVREMTAAERAREPFLKLAVERTTFYVGESVPFEATTFLRNNVALLDVGYPVIQGENFIVDSYGKPTREDAGGQGFQAYVFDSRITALKAGAFTFGPAKQQLVIREPYGMRVRNRPLEIESEPVALTVKPLPDENKPPGFAGAVGRFQLAIEASPRKLEVGEPIAVELRVVGDGNFDALTLPELTESSGWKPYPAKKVEIPNRQTGKLESLSFTQIIVPEDEKEAIPPFRLSFFDPTKEAYVTVETDPIGIEVTPDPRARTALVPRTSESPREAEPDATPPVESMDDILTILSDASATALTEPRKPLLRSTAFWAAQSVPLGALAAMLVVFFLRRRANGGDRPAQEPPPFAEALGALGALPASEPARAFYHQARACRGSGEFHHPDQGPLAARLDDDPRLAAVVDHHDFLNYSGNEALGNLPPPETERRQVVEALEALVAASHP